MEGNQTGVDAQEWDWEVLVDESHHHHHPHPRNPNSEIEAEDEGEGDSSFSDGSVIRSDYFSLEFDSHGHGHGHTGTCMEIEMEIEADKPESETGSWMDPDQVQFPSNVIRGKKRRGRFSSSSQSDSDSPTDGRGSDRSCSSHDLLLLLQSQSDCSSHPHPFPDHHQPHLQFGSAPAFAVGTEIESPYPFSDVPPKEKKEDEEENCEHDHSTYTHVIDEEDVNMNDNISSGVIEPEESIQACSENGNKGTCTRAAWWKVPLELLRYCLLRVRPVWSLSVAAAAIMGFVLLRRAWLFKMKRKTQKGLRLNFTVDDKKVSQFMSRAARLNEAFSVVKRVPVIRPSLPAPGFAPWPVVGMR